MTSVVFTINCYQKVLLLLHFCHGHPKNKELVTVFPDDSDVMYIKRFSKHQDLLK